MPDRDPTANVGGLDDLGPIFSPQTQGDPLDTLYRQQPPQRQALAVAQVGMAEADDARTTPPADTLETQRLLDVTFKFTPKFPKSMSESVDNWRNAGHMVGLPPEAMNEGNNWSTKMAVSMFINVGMIDGDGKRAPELTDEMFGKAVASFRHLYPMVAGEPDYNERLDMTKAAATGVLSLAEAEYIRKLEVLREDQIAMNRGEEIDPEVRAKIKLYQEQFQITRSLRSRLDEPEVLEDFSRMFAKSARNQARRAPIFSSTALTLGLAESSVRTETELQKNLLYEQGKVTEALFPPIPTGGGPAAAGSVRATSPVTMWFNIAYSQLDDAFGVDAAASAAFRQAFVENRLEKMGVGGKDAKKLGLTGAALLANPELANEVLGAAIFSEVRRRSGMGLEFEGGLPESAQKNIDESAAVSIHRLLAMSLNQGSLDLINTLVAPDQGGVGNAAVRATQYLGDAFTRLNDATLGPLIDSLGEAFSSPETAGMAMGAATGIGARALYDRFQNLEAEVEALREEVGADAVVPPPMGGVGFIAPSRIFKELEDKEAKLWHMREALFNMENNGIAGFSLLAGVHHSDEILERWGQTGVQPEILREFLKNAIEKRVGQNLGKEFEKSNVKAARALSKLNKKLSERSREAPFLPPVLTALSVHKEVLEFLPTVVDNAVNFTMSSVESAYSTILADPEEAAEFAAAELFFSGAWVTAAGIGRAAGRAMRANLASRVLSGASTVPEAATRVKDSLNKLRKGTPAKRRLVDAAVANLETAQDNMGPKLKMRGEYTTSQKRATAQALHNFEKTMARLPEQDIYDVLRGAGAPEEQIHTLTHTGVKSLGNWLLTFRDGGRRVPTWAARQGHRVFDTLERAYLEGAEIPSWEDLPIGFDALDELGRNGLRGTAGIVARTISPDFERSVITRAFQLNERDTTLSVPRRLAEFYHGAKTDLEAYRTMASVQMNNITDFIQTQRNKIGADVREALAERGVSIGVRRSDLQDRARNLLVLENNMREFQFDVQSKLFDDPVELKRSPWWDSEVGVEDAWMWMERTQSQEDIYNALRRTHEDSDAFDKRMKETIEGAVVEGERVVDVQAQRRLKNNIADAFLSAPGVTDEISVDFGAGNFISPKIAKKILARRNRERPENIQGRIARLETRLEEQVRKLRDPDVEDVDIPGIKRSVSGLRSVVKRLKKKLDEDPLDPLALEEDLGVRWSPDLRVHWKDLQRAASVERLHTLPDLQDKALSRRMFARAQDLNGLPHFLLHESTRQFQIALKNRIAFSEIRAADLNRMINSLTDVERDLVNKTMRLWAETGTRIGIDDLRKRFPEMRRFFPKTDDDAAQAVLDYSDTLLQDTVSMIADSLGEGSRVVKDIIRRLKGPWVGQLFRTYELHRFIRGKSPRGAVETLVSPRGIDTTILRTQRSVDKFKAVTHVKGRGYVERVFATKNEAVKWARDRFGVKKVERSDALEGWEGTTALDDKVAILEPIGEKRFEALGPMTPLQGLAARLQDIPKQAAVTQFLNSLDRPGWAMGKKEWGQFISTPQGRRARRDYVEFPEDPKWGKLSGKRVHWQSVAAYNDFVHSFLNMEEAIKFMRDVQDEFNLVDTVIRGGMRAVGGAVDTTKQGVRSLGIWKNFSVIAWNLGSDLMLFSSNVLGFSHLARGGKLVGEAFDDLWTWMIKGEIPDKPHFREWVERGLADEFADLSGPPDSRGAQAFNEVFMGKDGIRRLNPRLKAFIRSQGFDPENTEPIEMLRAFVGQRRGDDPRITTLMEDYERISKGLEDEVFGVDEAIRMRELHAKLEDELQEIVRKDTASGMKRGATGLWAWLLGANRGRFGDIEVFSKKFYSMISNVGRLYAYYHGRLIKGWDPEFTGTQINKFMQSYSDLPQSIRSFSRSLVASPVVAFPYEAARITANLAMSDWPKLAAWILGPAALSYGSLIAGGIDPNQAWEMQQKRVFTGQYQWVGPDGGVNSISIPALSWAGFLDGQHNSMLSGLAARDDGAQGTLEMIGQGALDASSNFFLNPVISGGLGFALGRNPRNGREVSSRWEAMKIGFQQQIATLIPRETPFFGHLANVAQEAAKEPQRPGGLTYNQKVMGAFTGVYLRGVSSDLLDLTGQAVAKLVQPLTVSPTEKPATEGFQWGDFFLSTIMEVKRQLPGPSIRGSMDLRAKSLYRVAAQEDRFGDPVKAEFFRKQARELDKTIIETERHLRGGTSVTFPEGLWSDRDRRARENAREYFEPSSMFKELNLEGRAMALTEWMAYDKAPARTLHDFVTMTIATEAGRESTHVSNPEMALRANRIIATAISQNKIAPTHRAEAMRLARFLNRQAFFAERNFRKQQAREAINKAALDE